jgi:hypothetical protein
MRLNTKKAMEFNMPYIINSQCSQPAGMMQSRKIAMKQPNEYP